MEHEPSLRNVPNDADVRKYGSGLLRGVSSIVEGMASLLDVSGSRRTSMRRMPDRRGVAADAEALANDWANMGEWDGKAMQQVRDASQKMQPEKGE